MMTTMDLAEHSRVGPLRIAARTVVAAAPLGFVLAATKNPHTDGARSGLLILVASVVGVLAARRLPANRALAIVFGTVLFATTLVFTGYIGAETPDATWFGGGIVHGPVDGGQVALTFDDGPNLGATEKIMAILDAHGVKGTFFEVGKAIDANPQITRALYEDGQLLGNH